MKLTSTQSGITDKTEDFEDLFENATSGFLIARPNGDIIRGNQRFAKWLGYDADELKNKKFSGLLTVAGRIYYETHLAPLLRMQGFFDEVALELLCKDGAVLSCYVNGYERRDEQEKPQFIRLAVYKATDRRIYEQNLLHAKSIAESHLADQIKMARFREQFVAVLGHDLRNPLGAMISGTELLSRFALNASDNEKALLGMMKSAASRMEELIENVMDFARARLGEGLAVIKTPTPVKPLLQQVIRELQSSHSDRVITTEFNLKDSVNCDGARLSQLFSNLLANALTHGAMAEPVRVKAFVENGIFELSVSNGGKPIPPESIAKLFEPFTHEESSPSKQGLGLGLFIAAEIARAHGAKLSATSSDTETRFTFCMSTAS